MKADCLGSSSGMIASGEKQNLNHLYSQLNRLLEITESEEYDIHSRKYPLLEKKCEALIRNIREDLAKATSKEEIEDIIKCLTYFTRHLWGCLLLNCLKL